jgi:hypothetical protein
VDHEITIPEDIQAFLRHQVESHEQLWLLRWLSEHAEQAHRADELASVLGIPLTVVDEALELLHRRGLVIVPTLEGPRRFQFGPATSDLALFTARLLSCNIEAPDEVTKLLMTNAVERLRLSVSSFFLEGPARRKSESE